MCKRKSNENARRPKQIRTPPHSYGVRRVGEIKHVRYNVRSCTELLFRVECVRMTGFDRFHNGVSRKCLLKENGEKHCAPCSFGSGKKPLNAFTEKCSFRSMSTQKRISEVRPRVVMLPRKFSERPISVRNVNDY